MESRTDLKLATSFLAVLAVVVFAYGLAGDGTVGLDLTYDGDWGYMLESDDSATLYAYTGTSTDVTVPGTVGTYGFRVKTVSNCFQSNTSLVSVTVPEGVEKIGGHAFGNCTSLVSVTLPESLKTVGKYAFQYCTSLTGIDVPDNATLGDGAFQGCISLKDVGLPEGKTSLASSLFRGCTALETVTVPDSTSKIGTSTFENCTSLVSVSLPEGLTTVNPSAFFKCTSLRSVSLPSTLRTIGSLAFDGCTSLGGISFPESLTSIEPDSLSVRFTDADGNTLGRDADTLKGRSFVLVSEGVMKEGVYSPSFDSVPEEVVAFCGRYVHIDLTGCGTVSLTGAEWLSLSDGAAAGTAKSMGTYEAVFGQQGVSKTVTLTVYDVLDFTASPYPAVCG